MGVINSFIEVILTSVYEYVLGKPIKQTKDRSSRSTGSIKIEFKYKMCFMWLIRKIG